MSDFDELIALGLAEAKVQVPCVAIIKRTVLTMSAATGLVTDSGDVEVELTGVVIDSDYTEADVVVDALHFVFDPVDLVTEDVTDFGEPRMDDLVTIESKPYHIKQIRRSGLPRLLTLVLVAT